VVESDARNASFYTTYKSLVRRSRKSIQRGKMKMLRIKYSRNDFRR
jgi:hypothetical protein